MFRKIALALSATAVIGAAALTPTTASAWHHHHHGHGHWRGGYALGVGIVAPAAVLAADCYVVKKVVNTPLGPQIRRITVCG
jgi:uncharacterized membrane protein YfcA